MYWILAYIALITVASMMLGDDGWGILGNPFRSGIIGAIGGMGGTSIPIMIAGSFGSVAGNVAFIVMTILASMVVGLYVFEPVVTRRAVRRMQSEREAQAKRTREAEQRDPLVLAREICPDMEDAVGEAVGTISAYLRRTEQSWDPETISTRAMTDQVSGIVTLTRDAIADRPDDQKEPVARRSLERVVEIGRFLNAEMAKVRTSKDDELDMRLRYVDGLVSREMSPIP